MTTRESSEFPGIRSIFSIEKNISIFYLGKWRWSRSNKLSFFKDLQSPSAPLSRIPVLEHQEYHNSKESYLKKSSSTLFNMTRFPKAWVNDKNPSSSIAIISPLSSLNNNLSDAIFDKTYCVKDRVISFKVTRLWMPWLRLDNPTFVISVHLIIILSNKNLFTLKNPSWSFVKKRALSRLLLGFLTPRHRSNSI